MRDGGFSLVELLVSLVVVALLTICLAKVVDNAATVTVWGTKRIDTASNVRPFFARLAADFSQMIRRKDSSYYMKLSPAPNDEAGNDQISFFSLVDGFYPMSTTIGEVEQPQTTLISYRVNPQYQLERMAKSLPFAGQARPTPCPSLPFGALRTLSSSWPSAISATATDVDYTVIAPDVFRFEYYYILKSDGSTSAAPWPSIPAVNINDIGAIAVCVAVLDPKSRALLSPDNSDLANLASAMNDYLPAMKTTGLLSQWKSVVAASMLPRPALSGIRLHQRFFFF